jgi:hypothetical protein
LTLQKHQQQVERLFLYLAEVVLVPGKCQSSFEMLAIDCSSVWLDTAVLLS